MSRQIKFRAWDKSRNKMFTSPKWVEFNINSKGELSAKNFDYNGNEQQLEVIQYTGLTDKNGVLIYESDILKFQYYYDYGQTGEYKTFVAEIRWSDECCGFHPICSTGGYEMPRNRFEVIGNIHENPELLEK